MLLSDKMDFEKLNGLIPAIIQDAKTNKVLMLGFMNEEALERTRKEGQVTFSHFPRESSAMAQGSASTLPPPYRSSRGNLKRGRRCPVLARLLLHIGPGRVSDLSRSPTRGCFR